MDLKNKLFGLTAYGLLDTMLLRLFAAVSFIILVHLLSKEDIGIIGVASGYMVIFNLLAIAPETVILRDYPKIKNEISRRVSAFMIFWLIRLVLLTLVALGVSVFLFDRYQSFLPAFFFLGSVLVYNLTLFPGLITQVFYAGFKQKTVTWINILLNLIGVGLLVFLFMRPNLVTYLIILMVSAVIGMIVWYYRLKKDFSFKFENRDSFAVIKESIYGFTLWNHLNSAILNMIYQIDTLIISFFVLLSAVGDYTIALGIANFFFIVPQVLQRSVFIGFSNIDNRKDEGTLISAGLKYSFILGIGQLLFFIVFGKAIINMLFTQEHVSEIYVYCLLITCGVTILNIMRPIASLINSKCALKEAFLSVYLPAGIFALAGYLVLTVYYGPVGTAAGNILAYAILSLFLWRFVSKKYPLNLEFELLSEKEKEVLRTILK